VGNYPHYKALALGKLKRISYNIPALEIAE
jgi:hypothetical protein